MNVAGYTAIADVSEILADVLRKELVPELIPGKESIGLVSPADRGDFALGIYLYDICESKEIKVNTMMNDSLNSLRYPSVFLNLYYVITPYFKGDINHRTKREHIVLGRIIQHFHDYPVLPMKNDSLNGGISHRIEMQNVSVEEKMRIWNFSDIPYKLSVFYKVYPVEVEGERTKDVTRVTEVDVNVNQKKPR